MTSRWLLIAFTALFLHTFAAAQDISKLPPEAQRQLLERRIGVALQSNDFAAALDLFTQYRKLSGGAPPMMLFLEGKTAFAAGRSDRTLSALEAYFKEAKPDDDRYGEAVALYDEASKRAAQDAAAAKAAAEAEAAQKREAARRAAEAARVSAVARQAEGAAAAGVPAFFKDCPTCPEMAFIPGGQEVMGAAGGPAVTVTLAPFAISKYEVTWDEWDACVRARGCSATLQMAAGGDQNWGRGRRPVINVSHADAVAYVAWLSRTTRKAYKLPNEAQWQYAARADAPSRNFPWGDEPPVCDRTAFNGANAGSCPDQRTWEVGSFLPNGFGVYDVIGNVAEWSEQKCAPHAFTPYSGSRLSYSSIGPDGSVPPAACASGTSRFDHAYSFTVAGSYQQPAPIIHRNLMNTQLGRDTLASDIPRLATTGFRVMRTVP